LTYKSSINHDKKQQQVFLVNVHFLPGPKSAGKFRSSGALGLHPDRPGLFRSCERPMKLEAVFPGENQDFTLKNRG
jgi:hypothetical protein